jgi:glycerol-3-phosphate responsive antiterminator
VGQRVVGGVAVGLPRLLVPAAELPRRPPPGGAGILLRRLTLMDLVRLSAAAGVPLALDVDSVEGLAPDEAAVAFLRERLQVSVVITRRPALAARAWALGCLPLLHVHCLDSTGLEHAMAAHPGPPVGTAVSPGLILAHLSPAQRSRLPRPLLAYGLIERPADRDAAFAAGADAVVLPPDANARG